MAEKTICIKDKLTSAIEDEENGVSEYNTLADEADKEYPNKGYGYILRGIAKEEATHRKLIKQIIDDIG